MTPKAMQAKQSTEPLDEAVDHVRGPRAGPLILEYGDYECPYSRRAFHEIERVEQDMGGRVRFAFRHFPLVEIHPHAFAAAAAAEAAAFQDRFWDMHELLFHRQKALEDEPICSGTPPSSGSTSHASTATDPAPKSRRVFVATSRADWRPARCGAHRPSSSTASSTSAATTPRR